MLPDEIAKLVEGENREKIYSYLKQLGFSYVTLDLGGYRMGSMNETLDIEKNNFVQEAGMNFPIWKKIILHK